MGARCVPQRPRLELPERATPDLPVQSREAREVAAGPAGSTQPHYRTRTCRPMTFYEVIGHALQIRKLYERYEQERYGRSWSDEEIMLGFLGDLGDLAKLVL